MLSRKLIAILALFVLSFLPAVNFAVAEEASVAAETPRQWFVQHQVGANQGLYALGLGYRGETFEPSFSYGYTPPIRNGAQVTQGNFKFNWKILDGNGPQVEWLAGASILINIDKDTFFTTPKKYPNRYYPPNAYFFALNTTIRHHGFFVEASIIDYYLEVAARNNNSTEWFQELLSVGFGYNQDVDIRWPEFF